MLKPSRPLLLALVTLAAACDDPSAVRVDSTGAYSTGPITLVETRFVGAETRGETVILHPGDSVRIGVTARDRDGRPVRIERLEWLFREPPRNITVDSSGVVHALAHPGGAAMWARVNGQFMSDIFYVAVYPRNPTPRLGGRWHFTVTDAAAAASLGGVVQVADSLLPNYAGRDTGARGIVVSATTTYCALVPPACDAPLAWPLDATSVDTLGTLSIDADRAAGGVYESLQLSLVARADTADGTVDYRQYVIQGSRPVVLKQVSGPVRMVRR